MPKDKNFMRDWMNPRKTRDLNKLSRFTIDNDRYDREAVQKLLAEMKEFNAYREKLSESKAGDLAYDVWQDLWLSLWKVDPEDIPDKDIRPDHLINKVVMDEAEHLSDHAELRRWCMGDDIGTAMACNTLEPDVETIYDKLEEEIKKAQQLQQMMQQLQGMEQEERDLEDLIKEWTEDHEGQEPGDEQQNWQEQLQALKDRIDQQADETRDAAQELRDALDQARGGIRQAMAKGMKEAREDQELMSAMAEGWGHDPGQLHRLPAAERMRLAQRMNDPRFRKMAELIGAMKRLAFAEQRKKVNYAPEEIYDIELGANLQRVLPVELGRLGHPLRKVSFLKDFAQKSLMQYKMKGHERVAKGGIVYCHDGSGSMHGDREMWAKAVGLCLLHIARKQKRPFYAIQFGSPGQIRVDDFRDSQHIDPDKVIDFAEFFFGGGTDFMTPLNHAVVLLNDEFQKEGRTKSDIVFATDGQCGVQDAWMQEFKKEQAKIGFTVYGIIIGGGRTDEPLASICDGKVASIKSIMNGNDVRSIFGAL